MKKLYLILLMLLILFIPATNAVAIYQLDQPIKELNNHTLREVFEDTNLIDYLSPDTNIGAIITPPDIIIDFSNNFTLVYNFVITDNTSYYIVLKNSNLGGSGQYVIDFRNNTNRIDGLFQTFTTENDISLKWNTTTIGNNIRLFRGTNGNNIVTIDTLKIYDMTSFGIDNLNLEQMDTYYDLYLEAIRFENENLEASQDVGGYQNIFRSIINGVKNLMESMGSVWQFLNAPLITSDMSDFKFEVDWSWDLIGMLRQVLSAVQVLTLQVLLVIPSLIFAFFGIPVQVSILSLLFSNFIFLLLGWIMVKSFLI